MNSGGPALIRPFLIRRIVPKCMKRHKITFHTSPAQTISREGIESLLQKIRQLKTFEHLKVEALGEFRRGAKELDKVVLLFSNSEDTASPTAPDEEIPGAQDKIRGVHANLIQQGLAIESKDKASLSIKDDEDTNLHIHYASAPCLGAARLYLTGDESYIHFLKLLAREAMGMEFDQNGLWYQEDDEQQKSSQRKREKMVVQEINQKKDYSPNQSRMEEQRKAMGLPEGLDLSLDLNTEEKADDDQQEIIDHLPPISTSSAPWKRIIVGKGNEEDLLDVLGLVWTPAHLRFVNVPKE